MSDLVSDSQTSWRPHIHLAAETHLSEYKGGIMAQCMTEVHTERREEWSGSVPSGSFCPVLFSWILIFILCQAAHRVRPRSGIVLLIHIRLPGSPPSQMTAPPPSLDTARADQQASVGTHKPYQSKRKIKASHCAEDNEEQKFLVNFPQPVFGTTSIHNSKLLRWCLKNMMSLPT